MGSQGAGRRRRHVRPRTCTRGVAAAGAEPAPVPGQRERERDGGTGRNGTGRARPCRSGCRRQVIPTPMEPSQRSPGSGDGIRTETPPKTPPGPPRSERGRKRRAGGDSELLQLPRGAKRPKDGDGGAWHNTTTPTDGDRLFAQKCRELRGFIRPLTELLNGLRMGRYDKGLSSFQQSVAMDRIQRIIGVLQKPEMGARYLGTLLQVEVMLKVWFPHVAPKAGPEPDPVGVLLLLRDRHSAHGDGATSGTSGGSSGTTSGVTSETTPTGTTQPKCPLPTRTGALPTTPDV
ncbi:circadian-associated transcriptional repressor [Excalfactoria chinensis]|uniref:circadian-associated transcriptional repressor n=1 Tax=Excalfactoria chinensis TaxID=46218 RepID=UPI003B3A0F40